MLQRYDSLGPTPRLCLKYSEKEIIQYLESRDDEIEKINDLNTMKHLFDRLVMDSRMLSFDTLSHKICLIRRLEQGNVDNPRFTVTPISDSVSNKLALQLEQLNTEELMEMWRKFSNFPHARGMLGSVFEAYVHQRFRGQIKLEASSMLRGSRSNSRWHASFGLKTPATVASLVETITIVGHQTVLYRKDVKLKVEADVYCHFDVSNFDGIREVVE